MGAGGKGLCGLARTQQGGKVREAGGVRRRRRMSDNYHGQGKAKYGRLNNREKLIGKRKTTNARVVI